MTDFSLGQRFEVIVLGATAVWNLDPEARAKLFRCVREHLTPNGVFLFTAMAVPGFEEATAPFEYTSVFVTRTTGLPSSARSSTTSTRRASARPASCATGCGGRDLPDRGLQCLDPPDAAAGVRAHGDRRAGFSRCAPAPRLAAGAARSPRATARTARQRVLYEVSADSSAAS